MSEELPIVDDAVVERLRTLRDQVARPGEDVLGELLHLFVRDTTTRLAAIRAAVDSGNHEDRRQAAHALKGSAGNVGAMRLAAHAARVERESAGAADVDRLQREVDLAITALRQRLV